MPSMVYNFRLPPNDRKNLLRVARLVGLPPSTFVAMAVGAIVSGDLERLERFNADMVKAMNGQLSLSMERVLVARPTVKRTRKGGSPP